MKDITANALIREKNIKLMLKMDRKRERERIKMEKELEEKLKKL